MVIIISCSTVFKNELLIKKLLKKNKNLTYENFH
ncbi:hypothetical protein C8P67_10333 [Flavobacterium aquicola]|uniref:Uncharacterized protein n=1 Tax=Flavobacterium aquicola TaxID=1682742 RepID=A0A3E0EPN5_9FLAO|nr:hypothetical protein C8P67_10333 [Flavobacterium aquicola]